MSDTTATAPTPEAPNNPTTEGNPQSQPETDWKARFEAQQKVNRDLEAKYKTASRQTQAIAQALGVPQPEEEADIAVLAATVRTLQEQFTQSQHANTVLTVAAQHNITDPKKIEKLGRIQDEATLREIAAELAQPIGASDTSTAPGPRPDLSQGAQGTPAAGDPATAFANFLGAQLGR